MEDECFVPPLIRITRCFLCPCNAGACCLITSHTAANPDRKFFKCSEPQQCCHGRFGKDFFKWADQVRADEMIDVPYCGGCMAGPCRVRREPNSGKILFTCHVKEGQGSCGYRIDQDEFEMSLRALAKDTRVSVNDCNATASPDIQPVEEEAGSEKLEVTSPPVSLAKCNATASPGTRPVEEEVGSEKIEVTLLPVSLDKCNATVSPDLRPVEVEAEGEKLEVASPLVSLAYCNPTASTKNGVVEKIGLGERLGDAQLQSPSISTSRRPKVRRAVSRKKMKQSNFEGAENTKPLRTPLKRLRNGNKVLAFSVSGNPHMLHLVMKSMMLRQQWWMAVAMHKKLGSQLQGWWGRLAFYPLPKPMIYALEPRAYCVIPSRIDPVLVVQEKKLVNSDAAPNLLMSLPESESALLDPIIMQNDKPVHVGVSAINSKNTPDSMAPVEQTRINNVVSESVSKVFVQAAKQLQYDLITFLEKMDFKDHQAMVLEAEAMFTALDRLGIDHQHFDRRVSEFISCSKTLAAVEQSMPKTDTFPEMELCHKFERMKLDKMESAHLTSVDTLIRSKKSLAALRDLIDSAKKWLYLMEIECLCCDVELGSMESQLEKNSEDKLALEKKYLDASKELEGSMKLHEQRGAAKAAFDRAKASLRG